MGAAAAGVGIIGGIAQTVMGAKDASKARKAIDSYQRQELTNAYKGLSVSTRGADLQQEQLQQATATTVGALRSGGARTLLGGIGKVQRQNVAAAQAIGADLDQQQRQIDQMVAGEESNLQQMQERREEADLAGLGQQLASGRQTMMSGLGNIAGAVGGAAQMQMMGDAKRAEFVANRPQEQKVINPFMGGAVGFGQ